MHLHGRGRIGCHLSRQRAELLGLSRQGSQLLAPIGCLQFYRLGKVLRSGQALCKIEAGIDVALSDVDDLAV